MLYSSDFKARKFTIYLFQRYNPTECTNVDTIKYTKHKVHTGESVSRAINAPTVKAKSAFKIDTHMCISISFPP